MTTILCNQQYCDFNKSEKCLKEHITLCNITSVPRHFWFACFTYSGKDPSVREKTIRETFKQIEEIIGDDFLPYVEGYDVCPVCEQELPKTGPLLCMEIPPTTRGVK